MAKNKNHDHEIPLFKDIDLKDVHPVESVDEEKAEKYKFETVDFADPNRAKTCLEVDFPIVKVNEVSSIEQNATKPIYMMSKWWARRRSSVFRQLLIASATKSPQNMEKAAQASWGLMYKKRHSGSHFKNLQIADIFMGGGTTVLEASRLGFNVHGVDLNPIAWWIVYNETHPVSSTKLSNLYKQIEEKVKPVIMPFYAINSPYGHKGEWLNCKTNKKLTRDIWDIDAKERQDLVWNGSELIYTFWMKHSMCEDPSCCHLTPVTSKSMIAKKSLTVSYYDNCVCPSCGDVFNIELNYSRLCPEAKFILGQNEEAYAAVNSENGTTICPHCSTSIEKNVVEKISSRKTLNKKKVHHKILIDKDWLKGVTAPNKGYYGGYSGASISQNEKWLKDRLSGLKYIEVRGEVPEVLNKSNIGKKKGTYVCGKCGRHNEVANSSKLEGHVARFFPYLIQGFDPVAKEKKYLYRGRFFSKPDIKTIIEAEKELNRRSGLSTYIPNEDLWFGHQTHQRDNLPGHGYKKWKDMFNPRQLLVNSLLLKTIVEFPDSDFNINEKSQVLGGWQNFLRHNCMFAVWDYDYDKLVPQFANNNYHPKTTCVENAVFSELGRGNFLSCVNNVIKGNKFFDKPYDLKINNTGKGGKSVKQYSTDKQIVPPKLYCQSSTNLKNIITDSSIDLIITDPPFGDNVQYAELSDFFLVWLAKPLKILFPNSSIAVQAPKTLEAVANKARKPGKDSDGKKEADKMYDRLLTSCWKESYRILKNGGLLAFTFHHDKDIAWINVLDSLFKAGFIVETVFPIRSDSTQADGAYGAKKIEFDIVHVCKKRLYDPKEIYWASLRRQIVDSLKNKSLLLAQHKKSGLHFADLEVMIRGEVLEKYSQHYGCVKKNLAGDLLSVEEILLEGSNIAQNLLHYHSGDKVPEILEVKTKLFLSLFRDGLSLELDSARKRLKGIGVSVENLISHGWVKVYKQDGTKVAEVEQISNRWTSLSRKRVFSSDLDQAHFAVNCCLGGKQLDGKPADLETWIENNYKSIFPSVAPLLKYMESNHFGADYKQAIGMAYRTLERTLNKIKESDGEYKKASDQLTLFDYAKEE